MTQKALNNKGFNLIEVIISITLIGIVAVLVIFSGVHLVKNFLFAKTNADTLLKGQIAIARLQKELGNVQKVYIASTNGTKITFTSYSDGGMTDHTIFWGGSGTDLLLDGDVLTDKVVEFSLAYYNNFSSEPKTIFSPTSRIIELKLKIIGHDNLPAEFCVRISPFFEITIG